MAKKMNKNNHNPKMIDFLHTNTNSEYDSSSAFLGFSKKCTPQNSARVRVDSQVLHRSLERNKEPREYEIDEGKYSSNKNRKCSRVNSAPKNDQNESERSRQNQIRIDEKEDDEAGSVSMKTL